MLPHCLKLKIDAIVMLLKNLVLKAGLCNGIPLTVPVDRSNYIEAAVLTGVSVGTSVLIPRLQLASEHSCANNIHFF